MGWSQSKLCAALGLLTAAVAAGCQPQREAKFASKDDMEAKPGVVTMPGELRATYTAGTKTDEFFRYCAEPAPDVAAQAALKVATGLEAALKQEAAHSRSLEQNEGARTSEATVGNDGSFKATNSVDHTVTVLELAGRSQAVLLTRELAYRVCEAQLNGRINDDKTAELLGKVIEVSTSLAAAEQSKAKAKEEAATAERVAAEARLKDAQGKFLKAQVSGLDAGFGSLVEQFTKECFKEHAACYAKAGGKQADQKTCDDTLNACVEKKIKLLKGE